MNNYDFFVEISAPFGPASIIDEHSPDFPFLSSCFVPHFGFSGSDMDGSCGKLLITTIRGV